MMAVVASPVGERIRLRRQALGMTQEQLAARVDVSPSAVLGWEKDRYFPKRHQGALEEVLGISLGTGNGHPDFRPDLADFAEAALWSMDRYSEEERRTAILSVRAKRQAAAVAAGTG